MRASRVSAEVRERLAAIPTPAWNALDLAGNPFLRHEFLATLEDTGCVGGESGWLPRHVTIADAHGLAGAAPAYLKQHSYGEFVFDWSWAQASERAGIRYYPKLIVAVPFTPVTGPRLLCRDERERSALSEALVAATFESARDAGASSVHWLFPTEPESECLQRLGLLRRAGVQFHWHNPGFADFEAFLATLNAKRRKEIRRERRVAASAPVEVHFEPAAALEARHWRAYHALYTSTYDRKWGFPPLNVRFFEELARREPQRLWLAFAERDGRMVAGAHFLLGDDALYGRNWGCSEFHPALHFELCYYRAIEFCIARGVRRFEAGAQGEHKLMRGFLPTITWSAHWIAHPGLRRAVADFLRRERAGIDAYIEEMAAHSPFRRGDDAPGHPRRAG